MGVALFLKDVINCCISYVYADVPLKSGPFENVSAVLNLSKTYISAKNVLFIPKVLKTFNLHSRNKRHLLVWRVLISKIIFQHCDLTALFLSHMKLDLLTPQ